MEVPNYLYMCGAAANGVAQFFLSLFSKFSKFSEVHTAFYCFPQVFIKFWISHMLKMVIYHITLN